MTDEQMAMIIRDVEREIFEARGGLVYCISYIQTIHEYGGSVSERDIDNLIPKLQQALDIIRRMVP